MKIRGTPKAADYSACNLGAAYEITVEIARLLKAGEEVEVSDITAGQLIDAGIAEEVN